MGMENQIVLKKEFQAFKESQALMAERLFDEVARMDALSYTLRKHSKHKGRIVRAISVDDCLEEMRQCVEDGVGNCGSVFCFECRERKQSSLRHQFEEHYQKAFNLNETNARERLRYVTILHELIPVDTSVLFYEDEAIKAVTRSKDDLKAKIARFRRSVTGYWKNEGKDIWVRGTIHIELVDMDLFRFNAASGDNTTKQDTYIEFGDVLGMSGKLYLLVHTHFILDTGGIDVRQIKKHLASSWSVTKKQVLVQKLSTRYGKGRSIEHKIEDAFRNIANYGYNGSNADLSFATAWGESRQVYSVEERKDSFGKVQVFADALYDRRVDELLTVGQLHLLIRVHNALTDGGGKGLLVSIN